MESKVDSMFNFLEDYKATNNKVSALRCWFIEVRSELNWWNKIYVSPFELSNKVGKKCKAKIYGAKTWTHSLLHLVLMKLKESEAVMTDKFIWTSEDYTCEQLRAEFENKFPLISLVTIGYYGDKDHEFISADTVSSLYHGIFEVERMTFFAFFAGESMPFTCGEMRIQLAFEVSRFLCCCNCLISASVPPAPAGKLLTIILETLKPTGHPGVNLYFYC